MSKLRNVLEANFHNDVKDPEHLKYKKIIIDKLEEEIKQEIISEETERVIEAEERARTIRNIDRVKDVFLTVVVIGILVGVTGNQITELISIGKQGLSIGWTWAVAICLVGMMYLYFWISYLKQATNEIRKFKEKND